MKFGIVGAGRIGSALAKHLVRSQFDVAIYNSRGPESLKGLLQDLGPGAKAGTPAEIAAADIIVLAVDWEHLPQAISSLPSLAGKIVIDPSNPIIPPGYSFAQLDGKTSSEIVSKLVPGARLVKAFNTLPAALLASSPTEAGGHRVIFMSGDDKDAKAEVQGVIEKMGFAAIDLGDLVSGGKLQQIPGGPLPTLNLVQLASAL